VSINYRLGLLGFLDLSQLPDGKDYAHSANLGLLDQVEALRWVKRNIAAWGGDPDNVTIMGQSAGGGSVALLTCIDEAQGLFKRAIMMSGSVALTSSREQCQQTHTPRAGPHWSKNCRPAGGNGRQCDCGAG